MATINAADQKKTQLAYMDEVVAFIKRRTGPWTETLRDEYRSILERHGMVEKKDASVA